MVYWEYYVNLIETKKYSGKYLMVLAKNQFRFETSEKIFEFLKNLAGKSIFNQVFNHIFMNFCHSLQPC